ncbi:lipopolysaccharide biosynthesis protein [Bacteroides acidifaciens]|uniref:Uncharacterized protein n=2 Tax=Bacteroides acidifaciens TaxID=85831 RepID=A0A3L8AB96_9BACE|nr:oligosaccharide flippase family protein [Bacteroides acidifaciens]MBF0730619.1 oligosaccharide flippase family protein [Bacteroides acidifaciens]MBF0835553.1 oligosaccharide flippase family protein [Bacteroides acidifaciens]NDO54886.1 oligosaccharide flippase family protein [Bacteroides acidifaciens]RLT80342.1 hypothetical protein D7Y07_08600 [Bacteroides acidifaciens]TFU47708.1 hypothetical protein E4T97_14100 [Bacteroides acidifaciens]
MLDIFKIKGAQRSVKVKKNIIAMIGIKGISLGISLLYVPLLLHSMNSINYGIWLTLTSIVSWVAMCDIGLGNGLRNKLSETIAAADYLLGKVYISTAYVSILSIMCVLFSIFFVVSKMFLSWNSILNAPEIEPSELNLLVNVVFFTFALNFVLSLINSVLFALQMPAVSSILTTLGQFFSFVIVLVLVKCFDIYSLLILGSVISIVPVVVLIISSIILFTGKYKYLSPSFRYIDLTKIKDILALGMKFFVLQIITIVLYQTNNLIIMHIVSNEAVVEYNIAFKYMNVLLMIYTIIVTPLWSATTEAYVKGDLQWIMNVVKKMDKIAFLFILIGLIMLLTSDFVYRIWLDLPKSNVSIATTSLIYFYVVGNILYANYGYILNGIGKLNLQILVTAILAFLYIPFSYFLGHKYGLSGILSAFATVAIMNFVWSKIQFTKIISGKAYGIWNK